MQMTFGFQRELKIDIDDGRYELRYSIMDGNVRKLTGTVQKTPGWKTIWTETLAILTELVSELEKGEGLQSPAFQQSFSSEKKVYNDLILT
jgi:hypothetical protein